MKLFALLQLLALFMLGLAAGTTTTTKSSSTPTSSSSVSAKPTTVWVTITSNGALMTVPTIWKQNFMSTYTNADNTAPSGSIGMGSLTGSVGGVRTYDRITVSTNAAARYTNCVGLFVLFVNWML